MGTLSNSHMKRSLGLELHPTAKPLRKAPPLRSTLFAALVVFASSCTDNAQDSSPFILTMEELRQLSPETTAGFTYEVERGAILVTLIDRYGDGHIHRLILGDLTRAQALDLLAQKQAEFERAAPPLSP